MAYKEVEGDLIDLALEGKFDVIAHGCNCFCTMGAGIAVAMAKNFGCNDFALEKPRLKGDINKLGRINGENILQPSGHVLTVVNCYTQYGPGFSHRDEATHPLSYPALILCLQKINHEFKGKHVGLPQIGAGLAGGNWDDIKGLIQKYLTDCDVTVVIYKPKDNGSDSTTEVRQADNGDREQQQ